QGFSCSGEPSTCQPGCGDGVIQAPEVCDDGNATAGDGCYACALEPGVTCDSALSSTRLCGDDGDVYQVDLCGNPTQRVAECPGDCVDGACRCVIRVRYGGNDLLSGATWATAKHSIQAALDAAASARCEVWLQAGTYEPWVGEFDRAASFVLREGVSLYGGFAGNETSRDDRDWTSNPTYLDGGENAEREGVFHVLKGADRAHLDGVEVRGGNANDAPDVECGGGLLLTEADQRISNVTFRENAGIAVCSLGADLSLLDVVFEGNLGESSPAAAGGGLWAQGGRVSIADSFFLNNGRSLTKGGAIAISNVQLTIESTHFEGNAPSARGG